ncbi:YppE family protein [Bacillus sp. ISL-47]|uniref:YppE family protein n=1 Tax=Bacillus sp. ISL-47 TaxID=2819130 RepID=UPI001BECA117|nr:YppE family protein [Bacillus sp. ISL-47]MBT2690055.1 YppE family protein [Bacillus sp. ISL-47]MBT2707849.1 YppE family protein [Pseudomonas sp. ISL-84]
MGNEQELLKLTEKLVAYVQASDDKFKRVKESGEKGNFYNEVKPFADEVKAINDRWKTEAVVWVKKHKPKNLYPQQVESASEHIEMVSIQAFFPETSKTRFINYVNSAIYVLKQLIVLLTEDKRGT